MACGAWKVISHDEDELWRVFSEVEVERCDCVPEGMPGASAAKGPHRDRCPTSRTTLIDGNGYGQRPCCCP